MGMIRGQIKMIAAMLAPAQGWLSPLCDRRASVAIITAVAFPLMLGFVGLASEVSLWMLQRRVMQGVADAAAYSGAVAIASGNVAGYRNEALGVAAADGYTTGVTVNSPPSIGSYTGAQYGATGYSPVVEVIISVQPPTLIAAFFGVTGITVSARATAAVNAAGHTPQGTDCVLALDPTAAGAVTVSGTGAALSLTDCGMAVNSNSSYTGSSSSGDAINTGSGSDISVTNASVSLSGTSDATFTMSNGNVYSNQKPVANPYAYLSVPSAGACPSSSNSCNASNTAGGETANTAACNFTKNEYQILVPGTYCSNDFELDKNGTTPVVTLLKGTYILDNVNIKLTSGIIQDCSAFLSVPSSGACNASSSSYVANDDNAACQACKANNDAGGVTVILTGSPSSSIGTVSVTGGGNLQIVAPTAGIYAGIALWQDINAPVGNTDKLAGGSGSLITGAIYMPSASLTYHGGTSATAQGCTQFVVDTITITGSGNYDGTGCQSGNNLSTGGKIFGIPGLVE
jgi:hypothetical protein